MYYNGDLNYNGHYSSDFGLIITEVPQITHSEIQGNTYDVPNRDGLLYDANTKRSMASIKVRFALKNHDYRYQLRQVRRWLSGRGRLTISDAPDSFYEVKRINLSESQLIVTLGYIEAEFIIEPYEYLWAYDKNKAVENGEEYTFKIDTDIAYPLFEFDCTQSTFVFTSDDKQAFIEFSGITAPVVIDSKRKIIYNKNTRELINAEWIAGDFDSFKITRGNINTLLIDAENIQLKIRGGYII